MILIAEGEALTLAKAFAASEGHAVISCVRIVHVAREDLEREIEFACDHGHYIVELLIDNVHYHSREGEPRAHTLPVRVNDGTGEATMITVLD